MAKNEKMTALAKRQNTEIAAPMEDWEKALAAKAQAAKASEVIGIPRITHRGGILKVDGKKVEGNKLQFVIACYGRTNNYFEKEFDPDSSQGETPDCYAFGGVEPGAEEAMKPHAAAPKKQHDQCVGCPWNEFGSGKGNSKKCANTRKLLVYAPNDDAESLVKGQLRQMSVPPGSLRGFGNYLNEIEEETPYGVIGVVTEVTTEALETGAYKIIFKAVDRLDKEFVKAIYSRVPSITRHLSEPYPVIAKKADEKPAKRRGVKGQ
jgi:hypothetical protein